MKKSILALAAVVALAPAAASAQQQPVRVGGNVTAPERVRYVPPVYPGEAVSARVSGIVILEAVVGTGGDVSDAKVLKSIPLLDEAALDAVRQWRYTPTTLNGVPVPVIMTVTVNFTIDGGSQMSNTAPNPAMGSIQMSSTGQSSLAQEWNGAPPIRIGGTVPAPERVKYVSPVYPALAQQSKVSGIVILEAIIDESGNVAMTKVIKSVPMLDDAALAAASQWKYTPTLVNGVAVPVLITVTVSFTLQLLPS